MNTFKIAVFIVLFVLLGQAGAQSFQATVNRSTATTDDVIEVSFTYSGKDINGVDGFQAPVFTEFKIVSGPNQSTSMQFINGVVSGQKSFSYYIQPLKTGKLKIPPASVTAGGEKFTSNSLTVDVTKGTGKPKKDESSDIDMNEIAENLFIRAFADKSSAFTGEQVTVTYKLYTRLNISTPQISKLPNYQGFWAEEIDMPQVINFSRETIDGVVYNVATLKKAALFPQQTGELSVTQYELKIPVVIQRKRKSNDPWGDFFNDPFFRTTETVEYTAKSNVLKIQSKELPPQNSIKNFTGAVGSFTLKSSIDKERVKQGDPVRLSYTLIGTGNISLLTLPEFDLGSGIEKYEDKSENTISRTGIIAGKKSIEYLLIPRNAGEAVIPPLVLSFFNPSTKKYETIEAAGYSLEVTPNADFVSSLPERGGRGETDIRYIKTTFTYASLRKGNPFGSSLFWVLAVIPFIGFGAFAFFFRRRQEMLADLSGYKELQAKKFAAKQLKEAKKLMDGGDRDGFYLEISRALQKYLENKLRIPAAAFSIEAAEERLKAMSLEDELMRRLKDTYSGIQFVRFAPASGAGEAMNSVFESASGLITGLEKSIAKGKK
ncbi:MAG: protein BatD [Ignavibacteriaceae bacterium]|nr:protein BatD [Ignavibacteriaceae bacterium]